MSNTPLVSVVTPSYNAEKFVAETIQSVQDQLFKNWEMIVVDDASTDQTVEIVKKAMAADDRISLLINENNIGQGLTRNRAIEVARGRYIAFLDSDDLWGPNKLEKQLAILNSTGAAMTHTSYAYIDVNGQAIKEPLRVSTLPIGYNDLLKRTEIGCLTAVYDTNVVGKKYMPDLPRSQDYALWLSILREGHVSVPINEVLAFYRIHDNNISKNKWKKIPYHWIVLRRYEQLGFFKSLYFITMWATRGVSRYFLK